ncbi:MAG: aromatic ring-hydroxylating dioxygenase subunit alpha [Pseudomonadota bacterium]
MSAYQRPPGVPEVWDRRGLPAWTYNSEELLELESDLLFRRHWQIVCHESHLPDPGDFQTLDLVGERAVVVRGKDGAIRAFHNVCRHRGSRVVADRYGSCKGALVCPFHGWVYNLDGTLRGAARPDSLPDLDRETWGLKPIEMEIWHGFIFVRFLESDQPSVADIMARRETEVTPYRLDALEPIGGISLYGADVNWKSVRDVDNEGYHVAMAHPALQDLYGSTYFDEPFVDGTSRSYATFDEGASRLWSVRNYKKLLPEVPYLPESHRRAWLYIGLFPNSVLMFYPDSIGFYQEFPLSTGETLQRAAQYHVPVPKEQQRQMNAARCLSGRIDRDTVAEDIQLTEWSNEATRSSGYDGILLSDHEYGVRSHHDAMRALMPVMTLDDEPPAGRLRELNATMLTSTLAAE